MVTWCGDWGCALRFANRRARATGRRFAVKRVRDLSILAAVGWQPGGGGEWCVAEVGVL